MSEHVCGLCKTHVNPGAVVCVGCQGTVVYGATSKEVETAFKVGAGLGFVAAGGGWVYLWGYTIHALIAAALGGVVLGISFAMAAKKAQDGKVRTFRHL